MIYRAGSNRDYAGKSMKNYFEERPRTAFAVAGAIVGAIGGQLFVGNFGVAQGGGGFAVWGWAFGAVVGAYAGFRLGEWRMRKASKSLDRTVDR